MTVEEAIRQQTAPSVESTNTENSYKTMLQNLQGMKSTPATDQSDSIRQMYQSALDANKSQLESAYQQNVSALDAEESGLGNQYYEAQRQAQAQTDRQRRADAEYFNARGLNTGTEGQAELARQDQLGANLNSLRQSETEKRAEIARQRTLLGQQYQQAIQQAQAENDLQKAQALYDEAVRIDTSIRQAEQQDADRALDIFNILNNNALHYASAAASNGDLSVYRSLLGGMSDLYGIYEQQMGGYGGYSGGGYSGGGSYSGASGGSGGSSGALVKAGQADGSDTVGSTAWYLKIQREAAAQGTDVESYIRQNYKALGLQYNNYTRYANGANDVIKQYSSNTYKIGSESGYQIAAELQPGQTFNASDGSTWTKLSDGSIAVTDGDGMKRIAEVTYFPVNKSSTQTSGSGSVKPATSGTYSIGSEKGAAFAQMLNPGQSLTASDGSTWTKNADGSITVNQNGRILNGVVTYNG